MQDILSRRKLLLSGLLFAAGTSVAAAEQGDHDFTERDRLLRQRRSKIPGYERSRDPGYDYDWDRFDDPGYDDENYDDENYYDPDLLPPPEAEIDYPIEAVDPTLIEPRYRRQVVEFGGLVKPGTIIVDPAAHFLYHVREHRQAMRYGVGVGRDGFAWSGKRKSG